MTIVYPSIDWNEFRGNYIAVDFYRQAFGYMNEPTQRGDSWLANGPSVRLDIFVKSFDAGNCHWHESLVKRPGLSEKEPSN